MVFFEKTVNSYGIFSNSINIELAGIGGFIVSLVLFQLLAQYVILQQELSPSFYAYLGYTIAEVFSQLGAAYGIYSFVAAAVHKTVTNGSGSTYPSTFGFYYQYAYGTTQDFYGVFEIVDFTMYVLQAVAVSFMGHWESLMLWQKYEEMLSEGAMTRAQGYKFLGLGAIIGMGGLISMMALGDESIDMLGFFDAYPTDHGEYTSTTTGIKETYGSAYTIDIAFHIIRDLWGQFLSLAMAAGPFLIGFNFIDADNIMG